MAFSAEMMQQSEMYSKCIGKRIDFKLYAFHSCEYHPGRLQVCVMYLLNEGTFLFFGFSFWEVR